MFRKLLVSAFALMISVPAMAQETIKIGLILPMTGPFAMIGREVQAGVQLYLAHNGDRAGGRKVEILLRDDTGVGDVGKRIAQELIVNDKVSVLAGIGTTPSAVAIAPVATQAKIPMVVMSPSTSAITSMSPYAVRSGFTGPQVVSVAGEYFAKSGIKTAATLVSDFGPGIDHEEWFKKTFEAGGGKVIATLRSPFVNPEFSPFLQRAADAKPQALFIFVPTGQNGTLMRQFAERGLNQSGIKLLAAGDVVDESFLDQIGDVALGVESAFHYSDAHPSALNQKFVADFMKANDGLRPNMMAVGGYDGMALIVKALEKASPSNGTALVDAMKGQSWESPRGPMMIDPETRDVIQDVYLRRVEKKDGRLINAEFATVKSVKDPAKAQAK
jgi:branched-chain amino acid transport system substrate-binding protein